jgi:hypothetical protein
MPAIHTSTANMMQAVANTPWRQLHHVHLCLWQAEDSMRDALLQQRSRQNAPAGGGVTWKLLAYE